MTWFIYAALSALFAALTAILAKIGIKQVDSNLATAIRTVVIILFAWGIVVYQGTWKQLGDLSRPAIFFLVLSGITTGLSWLFYFRALQLGQTTTVVAIDRFSIVLTALFAVILLHEKLQLSSIVGIACIVVGTVLMTLGK